MGKLIHILSLGLLCVAMVSSMDLRGQGGKSEGGSSEEVADPITKDEFKTELEKFIHVFKEASTAMGETEALAGKARSTQTFQDWITALIKFAETVHVQLGALDPAFENLGHLLERIAESPDAFPPLPYCDSSAKLANGKTPILTNFEDARQLAFVEDLGCFKNKLLQMTAIDFSALNQPNYSELQAIQQYMMLLEEALQMEKAFDRFGEALVNLEEMSQSGGNSKRAEEAKADIDKLVRLLKQLNLGNRRK